MDISFMGFLMSLVNKKDICVPMQKLIEYEVLTEKNSSANLKDLLKQHEFKKGVDFLLMDIHEQKNSGRSGHNKKNYTLTPFAFKVCLIRSKNNSKNEKKKF